MFTKLHILLAVGEVRAQSAGSAYVDAELVAETVEQDVVIDGAVTSRLTDQYGDSVVVSSRVHTVYDVQ